MPLEFTAPLRQGLFSMLTLNKLFPQLILDEFNVYIRFGRLKGTPVYPAAADKIEILSRSLSNLMRI